MYYHIIYIFRPKRLAGCHTRHSTPSIKNFIKEMGLILLVRVTAAYYVLYIYPCANTMYPCTGTLYYIIVTMLHLWQSSLRFSSYTRQILNYSNHVPRLPTVIIVEVLLFLHSVSVTGGINPL